MVTEMVTEMVTAVVTPVHGRHQHLRAQHRSLGLDPPDHWVVVAMDEPALAAWRPTICAPEVVDLAASRSGLPLAAARNAGARRAAELGAEVIVFLDVDCLAGPGLVSAYRDSASMTQGVIWSGPVTYLAPPPPDGYDLARLAEADAPHPARPAPAPGQVVVGDDWGLFWSLSFALRAEDLDRVGGFCEDYFGYGAEDTDFAQCARAAGMELIWLGSARAFHQHHAVSRPPVEHLEDIVRNARIFNGRWGWWPMQGWLDEFESRGLIALSDDGYEVLA